MNKDVYSFEQEVHGSSSILISKKRKPEVPAHPLNSLYTDKKRQQKKMQSQILQHINRTLSNKHADNKTDNTAKCNNVLYDVINL